jgi:hypothetical protein
VRKSHVGGGCSVYTRSENSPAALVYILLALYGGRLFHRRG